MPSHLSSSSTIVGTNSDTTLACTYLLHPRKLIHSHPKHIWDRILERNRSSAPLTISLLSRTPSHTSFRFTPGAFDNSDSSEGSDTVSAHSAVSVQSVNSPATENPTISLDHISVRTNQHRYTPTETPDVDMSANVTTVAPVHAPPSNRSKRHRTSSLQRRSKPIRVVLE
jgi:hypothetical protein